MSLSRSGPVLRATKVAHASPLLMKIGHFGGTFGCANVHMYIKVPREKSVRTRFVMPVLSVGFRGNLWDIRLLHPFLHMMPPFGDTQHCMLFEMLQIPCS